ncbi:MAG: extracellular solute-binding protein [Verrucomicrobia bacterium]|nr:extracellular solute-binding protein [Verrucomicrobiota bacterium]
MGQPPFSPRINWRASTFRWPGAELKVSSHSWGIGWPSWRLVLDPQAGGGLIRWAVLPNGTIVDFEVAGIRQDSSRSEMALRFVEFLLAPSQQAALLGATGYFPVRSRPGQEWTGSTLIMPAGNWFDRSEFILWAYPRPVVVTPPPTSTGTNEITPSAEGGVEKAESETRKAENSLSR